MLQNKNNTIQKMQAYNNGLMLLLDLSCLNIYIQSIWLLFTVYSNICREITGRNIFTRIYYLVWTQSTGLLVRTFWPVVIVSFTEFCLKSCYVSYYQ